MQRSADTAPAETRAANTHASAEVVSLPLTGLQGIHADTAAAQVERWMAAARPRLVRLARAQGIGVDSADDVAQETLLEAWRHLDQLSAPEGFDAWLNAICRNVCRRFARAHGLLAARQVPLDVPFLDGAEEWRGSAEPGSGTAADLAALDPFEELDRQDMETLLSRALAYLPMETRAAVTLCYLSGVPQREAALHLGLTTRAVESRLLRARTRLREVLAGELRAETQAFGMTLDDGDDGDDGISREVGWQATRIWCWSCGRCRMEGRFERLAEERVALAMRCPGCKRRFSTRGVMPLGGARTFRPAYKRLARYLGTYLAEGVASGWQTCVYCGAHQPVRILSSTQDGERHGQWPGLMARMECATCGGHVDSAVTSLLWARPEAQHFMVEHPRWIGEPEMLTSFEGTAAICVRLRDATGAARLTLFAHARSLEVLAAFAE